MNVLLFQLDGALPSIALMRIAAHHRDRGDSVQLRRTANVEKQFWDSPDLVYASAIFRKSIPVMERVKQIYPDAIIGGTAIDPPRAGELISLSPVLSKTYTELESRGIRETLRDYSHYAGERRSMGFTMRGCRLDCSFCKMQTREGPAHSVATIADLWRGDPYPRELLLLVGYWPGETSEDREYRRVKLRDFGARPYPMPYVRTPELVGFQRWIVGAYDKPRKDGTTISWEQWTAADYRPENLGIREGA